jgi:hypothetical protein
MLDERMRPMSRKKATPPLNTKYPLREFIPPQLSKAALREMRRDMGMVYRYGPFIVVESPEKTNCMAISRDQNLIMSLAHPLSMAVQHLDLLINGPLYLDESTLDDGQFASAFDMLFAYLDQMGRASMVDEMMEQLDQMMGYMQGMAMMDMDDEDYDEDSPLMGGEQPSNGIIDFRRPLGGTKTDD